MAKLKIENLRRLFGRFPALDQASFELPSGKIFGFIGPNGAGKSTCLRILAGLDEADGGEIFIDGENVTDYPEKRRGAVAFMPDSLPESSDMNVWDYLDFFGRVAGLKREERQNAIDNAVAMTGLQPLLKNRLTRLSKGQKQQVSLARVLISPADILLLDEPTAGLDPQARIVFRENLFKIAAGGRTVLISSHILSELEDMISGVVMIEKGRIVRHGELQEVVTRAEVCNVIVSFIEPAEQYLQQIRELASAERAELYSPRQILVTLKGGDESYNEFMVVLFQSGLPVSGVNRADMGLQSFYLNTTNREVKA